MKSLLLTGMVLFTSALSAVEVAPPPFETFDSFKADKVQHVDMVRVRGESFHVTQSGELKLSGYGNLWTKDKSYDLRNGKKVIVKVDVKTDEKGGVGIGFSKNRQDWNSGLSDALTFWTNADKGASFHSCVRTEMYKDFLGHTPMMLTPNKWETITVELTKERITAYVEKTKVIDVDLSKAKFPLDGYVGLLQYDKGDNTFVKNFSID